MRIAYTSIIVAAFCLSAAEAAAQPSATPAPTQPAASTASAPSALLQPALDTVLQAVGSLKLDKWKGGSIRAEANANVDSIRQDLQTSLPPLLHEADAAPGSVSKLLPVSRNIDALYDVLLRVFEASRIAAPGDQAGQLQQATESLEKARHALNTRLQENASAQEKHLRDVQAALAKSQAAPVCPVVPVPACTTEKSAPAHKAVRKKRKPAAAKPAQPSTTQPPPAAKPQ